jgi:peptidoglycan/xylan/chitin deacetylase (PgdA/CDA1 family)
LTEPSRRSRGHLSIVTFHRVLPAALRASYPLPGLAVTPEELEWFLGFFVEHFTCGTLADSVERWRQGDDPNRPLLALTFDDGQRDNVDYGLPLLRQFGVRATFFVTVDHIGTGRLLWHDRLGFAVHRAWERDPTTRRQLLEILGLESQSSAVAVGRAAVARAKRHSAARRAQMVEASERLAGGESPAWASMMTWEQVGELAREHEIGSHTMSHALLPGCSDAELEREVRGSRRVLEEQLGARVTSFCYPNGDHDRRSVDAVRRAGYRSAVTVIWGSNQRRCPPFTLKRCDMHPDHARHRDGSMSAARLAWRMSGWYPGLR